IERLQEDDLSVLEGEELDRFLEVGIAQLERLCPGAFITEPGLIRDVEGVQAARIELVGDIDRLVGSLEFLYEDEWILAPLSPEARSVERDGRIRRFPPAGQALARAHSELEDMGFERDDDRWVATGSGKLRRILSPRRSPFVAVTLPDELESLDLTEREPTLELEIRTPEGLRLGTAAGEGGEGSGGGDEAFFIAGASGVSWLEASFTLSDGDRQLNVDANELRRASVASRDGLIELPDGTVLNMEHDTVRRLVELAEASSSRPGSRPDVLEISLASVSELLEVAPGRRVQFDEGLRGLVRSLQTSDEIEAPELRKSLDETLREYQKDALRWFGGLGRYGLGGILADEMGLGKTLMTLSHFFGSGELKPPSDELPLLIVCPTSLVFNWLDEAARFFPGLEAVGLHGLSSAKREELIQSPAHMLVTSYALLRRDRDVLSAKVWRGVVLDEGQHIKNPESQTAQAAFGLESRQRWVLTGTPIENHLGELWSLFHFAMPGFLGERPDFQRRWGEPSKRGDTKAVARLRKRVQPFVLRRTKDQVLTELPPRIEQVERVAMSSAQQAVYDRYLAEARSELSGSVGDANKARFKILAALTRLRQVCCHPALVDGGEGGDGPAASSGKFELLMELLDECFEEGHRVLLFSQFTSMLDIIERELESREILYSRLDGATRDREGAVAKFRDNPNVPVFLISLKAGGHGLNLTEADTVILYDPWWNPATEEQAAARAHRMGQELPVHVHKLITRGSVEEKILDLQTSKKELAGAVLGSSEEEIGAALDVDDLKRILAE
ncbi:MAG: DEAD/DEAH box helicase, partial [Planctomycetota bacterium]